MDDDSSNDVPEDFPKASDQFIQKFVLGRDALVAQERRQRSDHAFRQALSPAATEACTIVTRIWDQERRSIWTPAYEDSIAKEHVEPFPGMMFTLAKDRMERTRLWKIIKKMPKGALLHAHLDALVDLDFLFDQCLATEGIYILSQQPLSSSVARETASFHFTYLRAVPAASNSIWSPEYQASTPIPLSVAASTFPHGKPAFLAWLKSRCTITSQEALRQYQGLNDIWKKFTSIFAILNSMLFYEPVYRKCLRHMLQQLTADGIRWVDLRLAFLFEYRRTGEEKPEIGYEEMIRVLDEEIENFKRSEEGKDFWGARMIWTAIRSFDTTKIVDTMDECITVKLAYPHMISGFDLVGQEDAGRPLKDLLPELFWFRKQCAQEGVDIPFFFHAGECLGDGDSTDSNLFDAILLGTRRIGHGFSLYKHPLLIDMVKEKRILIESCPISNEVLRLTGSILSHPLPALLARGVSCSLCNDDPALLGQGSNGLSHDFWQALQGWDNLGLAGLGALAENSVRWAAFEDQTQQEWVEDIKAATLGSGIKAKRMKEWTVEWERFCQWVVEEYGDELGTDHEK